MNQRQAPDKICQAFVSGLRDAPQLGEEYAAQHEHHLPEYTLSLRDLAHLKNPKSLKELEHEIEAVARETTWQCVAVCTNDRKKAVVGELTPVVRAARKRGKVFAGTLRMTSLRHGAVIDEFYQKSLRLKELASDVWKLDVQDYEPPRMLRIPGILVTSFWLKAKATSGKHDWVIPFHTPKHSRIESLKVDGEIPKQRDWNWFKFLEHILPAADKQLKSEIYD